MPMISVEQELKKYRPNEPVKLYRFERIDHDPSKRETNKNVPLQSWSHDKKMVEDIVEMENIDLKEQLYFVKEKIFQPHDIYIDFTLIPESISKYYKKGESGMDEVLVYHYANQTKTQSNKKYYKMGGFMHNLPIGQKIKFVLLLKDTRSNSTFSTFVDGEITSIVDEKNAVIPGGKYRVKYERNGRWCPKEITPEQIVEAYGEGGAIDNKNTIESNTKINKMENSKEFIPKTADTPNEIAAKVKPLRLAMAGGGQIKNQYEYEGKNINPQTLWNVWTDSQRLHFLKDHYPELQTSNVLPDWATSWSWSQIPSGIKDAIANHIKGGQYKHGGKLPPANLVKMFRTAIDAYYGHGIKEWKDDPDMIAMYNKDKEKLEWVFENFQKDPQYAMQSSGHMDTAVREVIPGAVWESMGGTTLRPVRKAAQGARLPIHSANTMNKTKGWITKNFSGSALGHILNLNQGHSAVASNDRGLEYYIYMADVDHYIVHATNTEKAAQGAYIPGTGSTEISQGDKYYLKLHNFIEEGVRKNLLQIVGYYKDGIMVRDYSELKNNKAEPFEIYFEELVQLVKEKRLTFKWGTGEPNPIPYESDRDQKLLENEIESIVDAYKKQELENELERKSAEASRVRTVAATTAAAHEAHKRAAGDTIAGMEAMSGGGKISPEGVPQGGFSDEVFNSPSFQKYGRGFGYLYHELRSTANDKFTEKVLKSYKLSPRQIGAFLISRQGRHWGDELSFNRREESQNTAKKWFIDPLLTEISRMGGLQEWESRPMMAWGGKITPEAKKAISNWEYDRKPEHKKILSEEIRAEVDMQYAATPAVLSYLTSLELAYDEDVVPTENPDFGQGPTDANYIIRTKDGEFYFVNTEGFTYPRYITRLINFNPGDDFMKNGGKTKTSDFKTRFTSFIKGLDGLSSKTGIVVSGHYYNTENKDVKYSDDWTSGDIDPKDWKTNKSPDAPAGWYDFIEGLEKLSSKHGIEIRGAGAWFTTEEKDVKYDTDSTSGDIRSIKYDKGGKLPIPRIKKLTKKAKFYHARIESPKGAKVCATPDWGRTVASAVHPGAKITTCQDADKNLFIQKVMIPSSGLKKSEARKIAAEIAGKFSAPKTTIVDRKGNTSVWEDVKPKAAEGGRVRPFLDAVRISDHFIKLEDLKVEATPKGNWTVYHKGKKLMNVNGNLLDEETIRENNLEYHETE